MNGIHTKSVLQQPEKGLEDLAICYGSENLERNTIKYVTMAPELNGAINAIKDLKAKGILVSMGHTAATYEEAKHGINAGATMITHLFNQCNPLHHRNPGMFGLLEQASLPGSPKPFFGIIADGIHLHGSAVNIAWNAHPEGFILVTDAMSYLGLPDGTYDWTNGERITKDGIRLTLEGSTKIAGSSITLIECVNNFIGWSGASIAQALGAVTTTPAKMLGVEESKGSLEPGTDADLVVLDDFVSDDGSQCLKVDQVWKFGECVHDSTNRQ
jgi:N-acetylglucosamine-6-phosphate deacetylase